MAPPRKNTTYFSVILFNFFKGLFVQRDLRGPLQKQQKVKNYPSVRWILFRHDHKVRVG